MGQGAFPLCLDHGETLDLVAGRCLRMRLFWVLMASTLRNALDYLPLALACLQG